MPGASNLWQAVLAGCSPFLTNLSPIFPVLGPISMNLTPGPPKTPSPSCTLTLPKDQSPDHTLTFLSVWPDIRAQADILMCFCIHTILFTIKFTAESSLQRDPLWPPLNGVGSPVKVVPQLFPRFGRNCPKPGLMLRFCWA